MQQERLAKRLKRAFTITELVIVIAVIAILAAVLIPTFMNVTKKAEESADLQLVTQMNTVLQTEETLGEKPVTMSAALEMLEEGGFTVDKITPTSDGYEIVYDMSENRLTLLDEEGKAVSKNTKIANGETKVESSDVWRVAHTDAEANEIGATNGVYLAEDYSGTADLTLAHGFDAGKYEGKCTVKVENTSETGEIIINSSLGSSVTANVPNGIVKEYGETLAENVTAVAGSSYHLFGTVIYLQINKGHLVIENGASYGGIRAKDGVTVDVKGATYKVGASGVSCESGTSDGYNHRITVASADSIAADEIKNIANTTHEQLETVIVTAKISVAMGISKETGESSTADDIIEALAANGEISQTVADELKANGELATDSEGNIIVCAHEWTKGKKTSSTCTEGGYTTYTCDICESTAKKDLTDALGHNWDTKYTTNEDYHWIKCKRSGCSVVKDKSAHSYRQNTRTVKCDCGENNPSFEACIGETGYSTLASAISAAETNATVEVLHDLSSPVEIPAGKNMVLDLGGKTLTTTDTTKAVIFNNEGATVTVTNGTVKRDGGYYVIENYGTMALRSITLTFSKGQNKSAIRNGYNAGESTTRKKATLTIESGTYSANTTATYSETNLIKNEPESTLNINGGTFSVTRGSASRLVLNYGTANISGGTFGGKSEKAVCIEAASVSDVDAVVTITGGTFSGKTIDVKISAMNEGEDHAKVYIKGGTFNKQINMATGTYGGIIEISGGKFKKNPSEVTAVTIKGTVKEDGSYYTVTSEN